MTTKQLEIEALSEYVPLTAQVQAFKHAAQSFYSPELLKDLDKTKAAFIGNVLKKMGEAALPFVYMTIKNRIEKNVNMFIAMNGPRPNVIDTHNEEGQLVARDDTAALEWDDKVDDMLADTLEGRFRQTVGISWTEQRTVDTQAHDSVERDALELEAAQEYIKACATPRKDPEGKHDYTINKAAAQFGLTTDVINAEFDAVWEKMKTVAAEGPKASYNFAQARRRVEEIVIAYCKSENVDLTELQSLLANAADRDFLIASASLQALGAEPEEDHGAFRVYAGDEGPVWLENVISQGIEGVLTPMEEEDETEDGSAAQDGEENTVDAEAETAAQAEAPEPPADDLEIPASLDRRKAKKQARKAAKKKAKPADDAPPARSHGEAELKDHNAAALAALRFLRERTTTTDKDLATMLGKARTSVVAYASGKTDFEPDGDQVQALREAIIAHRQQMEPSIALMEV